MTSEAEEIKVKILMVDDESDLIEASKRFFERRGYTVSTATNGKEALDLLEKEEFDIVLLDIIMEELSGIEVLERMRTNGNNTKVIIASGNTDEDIIERAGKYKIEQFIRKPFNLQQLEETLSKSIKKEDSKESLDLKTKE